MSTVRTWIDRLADLPEADPAPEQVVLLRYPLRLGRRQSEHGQALLAELQALAGGGELESSRMRPPRRLLELADRIVTEFGPALAAAAARRQEAEDAGLDHVDLSYPGSTSARSVLVDYARLMEQVDVYARAGTLRTPPPDVALYALRRWTVEEFVRQLAGQPPCPWDGPAA